MSKSPRKPTEPAQPQKNPADTFRVALKQYTNALEEWSEIEPVVRKGFLSRGEAAVADEIVSRSRRIYKELQALAIESQAKGVEILLPQAPPNLKRSAAFEPEQRRFSAAELAQTAVLLAGLETKRKRTPMQIAEHFFAPARDLLVLAGGSVDYREGVDEERGRSEAVTFEEILASNKVSRKAEKDNGARIELLPGYSQEKTLKVLVRSYFAAVGRQPNDERYIAKRFLPAGTLAEMRAWKRQQKRQNAVGEKK